MCESDEDFRVQRIGELLDALHDPELSADETARLEAALDRLVQVRDPKATGELLDVSPEVVEYILVAERLARRQGAIMPDFDAIRRRKAALDRKLLRPPS